MLLIILHYHQTNVYALTQTVIKLSDYESDMKIVTSHVKIFQTFVRNHSVRSNFNIEKENNEKTPQNTVPQKRYRRT